MDTLLALSLLAAVVFVIYMSAKTAGKYVKPPEETITSGKFANQPLAVRLPTNSAAGDAFNSPTKKDPNTIFVPFVRGVGASLGDQLDLNVTRAGKSATGEVANDMTATVEEYESKGYEFQRIETVHVDVSPGCIGILMGKGKEYHPYDYFVFSKRPQETFNHPV